MLKKLICIGTALICFVIGFFVGAVVCNKINAKNYYYAEDRVRVIIKAEHFETFESKGFTVEDFNLKNVDKIEYGSWYDSSSDSAGGHMTIYLKKHGMFKTKQAVRRFKKLDFVENSERIAIYRAW